MNVKELAHETLIAAKILPKENVLIDVINPDWEGWTQIYITSEPMEPEDQTQFGIVSAVTKMAIHVIAQKREDAKNIGHTAATAAYNKFTQLERMRGSGILCITFLETNVFQIQQRAEYQSTFTFRILHKP